jgi:hypothetical protein
MRTDSASWPAIVMLVVPMSIASAGVGAGVSVDFSGRNRLDYHVQVQVK